MIIRNKSVSFILLIGVLSVLTPGGIAEAFSGEGSGTEQDPYIITNVYQLQEMNNELDAWYELANDIDASATSEWNAGEGFVPIGTYENRFWGYFDGKGHTITGLYINKPDTSYVALFGYVSNENADIRDLILTQASIDGAGWVGVLVGCLRSGTVRECGTYAGTVRGIGGVGGLVGENTGRILNCFASADVEALSGTSGGLVGRNSGFLDVMFPSGKISNCYASGSVTGISNVGGLVGYVYRGGSYISNCYAAAHVTGYDYIGGLVGYDFMSFGNYASCFWDRDVNPSLTGIGNWRDPQNVIGETTENMKIESTFTSVNWDFDTVWDIIEGITYPYLRDTPNPEMPVKGVDVSSWQDCQKMGRQDIDWSQVYGEGYRFALVRASWWDSGVDKCFVTNMENGHTAGMLMGAYHFAYPEYADAGSEARHFFNVAKDYLKEGYLRPALDIEDDPCSDSFPYTLGPKGLSDWVNKWMDTVQALARQELHTEVEPLLYVNRTYANFLDEHLADVYDLWIAHPKTPTCNPDGEPDTKKWNNWAFWQYYDPRVCGDNSGYVPGIEEPVDLDVFNGDMSRLNTFKISAWQPDFWILYHLCSPADMVVTDPDGLIISKELNQIPGAAYVEIDIDGDGDLDEEISIPYKKVGHYQITIVPEPNALSDDTYSLDVTIDGETMVLAKDVQIQGIPAEPYEVESKLNRCDFDTDGDVDLADLQTLVLHWLAEDCNYPDWCEGTDLNYNGFIYFADFATFADNWLWEKIPADLDIDGDVDFLDYAVFAEHWEDPDCKEPDWCSGADLNKNGAVDLYDLAKFAEHWLEDR